MKSLLSLLLGFPILLFAQNAPGTALHIKKAKGQIVLDGVLDEPDWEQAQTAGNWFLNYPVDTLPPTFATYAKLTFDDEHLYVAFICEDDTTPDMINSLRRDFDYDLNDNAGLVIGPYNDHLNGFFFTVTPKGVQMEGTVSSGGSNDASYSINWDNKWYSKVMRYSDRWIVEMAIPFKSFRYKSDITEWNLILDRQDKKRNFKSSWIRTPIQFSTGAFAFSGQLVWDDPIPPAHTNISLIPYVAGGISDLPAVPGAKPEANINAGFDAKIGIGPS
ncbi:MAG: carbohydrate binding family 9 domain-containing protein, partial [Bacteroidia bacterium]